MKISGQRASTQHRPTIGQTLEVGPTPENFLPRSTRSNRKPKIRDPNDGSHLTNLSKFEENDPSKSEIRARIVLIDSHLANNSGSGYYMQNLNKILKTKQKLLSYLPKKSKHNTPRIVIQFPHNPP
jgi:hypothetical protein